MILSLDFDAFYCAVEQHFDPKLVNTPFVVYQKNIIATSSYPARALGIAKLSSAHDVARLFPDIPLINGEDLKKYRTEGHRVYEFVRENLVKGCPIERLGLEEMWIDISDPVDFSVEYLESVGALDLIGSQGELEDEAAEGVQLFSSVHGAPFNCADFFFNIPGSTFPLDHSSQFAAYNNPTLLRAYVAAGIAGYIQERIRLDCGYSVSIGVAENKTLSKMVGKLSKPLGLSTLLPGYEGQFLADKKIVSIPYFGRKSADRVRLAMGDSFAEDMPTVSQVLDGLPKPAFLRTIDNDDLANKLWGLLHGDDNEPVNPDANVPKQLSIEDTYAESAVVGVSAMQKALLPIVMSLFRKTLEEGAVINYEHGVWIYRPTMIRLSVRYNGSHSPTKTSFSTKLPKYVYNLSHLTTSADLDEKRQMAERLIATELLRIHKYPRNANSKTVHVRMLNVALTGFTRE